MFSRTSWLVYLALSSLLAIDAIAATPQQPSPAQGVAELAKRYLDELKKPDYASSRCLLTPVLSTDQTVVAVSTDRVFSAGDVILGIGDASIDPNSKAPVRELSQKHGPNETVSVKLRRSDKELVVNAKCSDAKPYYDLLIEASYAASKTDFNTCSTKLTDAAELHAPSAAYMWMALQCGMQAGRITGTQQARGYYETRRQLILESKWSPDALSRIRTEILNSVDVLQKNNGGVYADDLKQQYDQALSSPSSPPLIGHATDVRSP